MDLGLRDVSAAAAITPALKEWSTAVHALLDGRQTVLLRKGGIHEKRFALRHSAFLLFPTSVHGHRDRVRTEHHDLLPVAAGDSTETEVLIRAGVRVIDTIEVMRPDDIDAISALHIWTDRSVREDRLDFRPKHRLAVLVVQACPLTTPVQLVRAAEYAGCRSWADVPGRPPWDEPVHPESTLTAVADRVRDLVG